MQRDDTAISSTQHIIELSIQKVDWCYAIFAHRHFKVLPHLPTKGTTTTINIHIFINNLLHGFLFNFDLIFFQIKLHTELIVDDELSICFSV